MDGKKPVWSRLIRPSTIEMVREGRRTRNYSLFDWIHGYVYGRWTYLYIGIGIGEHPVARRFGPLLNRLAGFWKRVTLQQGEKRVNQQAGTFADTYHGKVVPLQAATELVTIREDIRLMDLEKIIPYRRARDIVLTNPNHIAVLECPCRSARENPCLPLDICLIVGEPFVRFVLEHHSGRSRQIDAQEAVAILQAEEARGHVHHAFFKDAMLERFYAICNCCSCCCGAIQSHRNGNPMLASSGYVAQVDEDLCLGCGDCLETCQFGALSLDVFVSRVDREQCMGCGICKNHCSNEAIRLVRAPEKGEPLEIVKLMAKIEAGAS